MVLVIIFIDIVCVGDGFLYIVIFFVENVILVIVNGEELEGGLEYEVVLLIDDIFMIKVRN